MGWAWSVVAKPQEMRYPAGMEKRPVSAGAWNTALCAAAGALVGILLATTRHLLHDHSNMTPEVVLWHFVPEMLAALLFGAALFGGVSAIHNWLNRDR
jgi:hypothetical protein